MDDTTVQFFVKMVDFPMLDHSPSIEKQVYQQATDLCKSLVQNNPSTHNLQSLIKYLINILPLYRKPNVSLEAVSNTIFMVRVFSKYIIEHVDPQYLHLFFCDYIPTTQDPTNPLVEDDLLGLPRALLHVTVNFCVDSELKDDTYDIHINAIMLLISLLSKQMFLPAAIPVVPDPSLYLNLSRVFMPLSPTRGSSPASSPSLASSPTLPHSPQRTTSPTSPTIPTSPKMTSGQGNTTPSLTFFEYLMIYNAKDKKAHRASELVNTLMLHYINQLPRAGPAQATPTQQERQQQGLPRSRSNSILTAASYLWKLPMNAISYLFPMGYRPSTTPLADVALVLMLLLVEFNHGAEHAAPVSPSSSSGMRSRMSPPLSPSRSLDGSSPHASPSTPTHLFINPYRNALYTFQDAYFDPLDVEGAPLPDHVFRLPLAALFSVLTTTSVDDRSVLLVYHLLYGNPHFQSFVLSRTDIDTLLLPLLHMLYNSYSHSPQQNYMILIILLILSTDTNFNLAIHKNIIPTVVWYKERYMVDVSLGGILILVLIRTVQTNLVRTRDIYLHTNCIATLANMSGRLTQMHPYVAHRLLRLFEMLGKRYAKMTGMTIAKGPNTPIPNVPSTPSMVSSPASSSPASLVIDLSSPETHRLPPLMHTNSPNLHSSALGEGTPTLSLSDPGAIPALPQLDAAEDGEVSTYEDFMYIVVEIIHSAITQSLTQNIHLMYALLHQQELFPAFASHHRFGALVQEIQAVLQFFTMELQNAKLPHWSADNILAFLLQRAKSYHPARAAIDQTAPPQRFRYEEEEDCSEFFVPYVWSIVYFYSGLHWSPTHVQAFVPPRPAGFSDIFEDDVVGYQPADSLESDYAVDLTGIDISAGPVD
eukprot:TRINITY_DN8508_c0_g1_i3.p1 TRINITY_DN8508_c0_g1~~TRINITY_DN8508_c0_g1_i3.p1  ORF type:complete len:923 (-),score=184.22 TRINITY_DN8508_c0_g1_i3:24-2642(-)